MMRPVVEKQPATQEWKEAMDNFILKAAKELQLPNPKYYLCVLTIMDDKGETRGNGGASKFGADKNINSDDLATLFASFIRFTESSMTDIAGKPVYLVSMFPVAMPPDKKVV